MALGLACLVTGCVFFLISVGIATRLWHILGVSFLTTGAVLTTAAGVWCACAVKRDKAANPGGFYHQNPSEVEGETLTTSESTWGTSRDAN